MLLFTASWVSRMWGRIKCSTDPYGEMKEQNLKEKDFVICMTFTQSYRSYLCRAPWIPRSAVCSLNIQNYSRSKRLSIALPPTSFRTISRFSSDSSVSFGSHRWDMKRLLQAATRWMMIWSDSRVDRRFGPSSNACRSRRPEAPLLQLSSLFGLLAQLLDIIPWIPHNGRFRRSSDAAVFCPSPDLALAFSPWAHLLGSRSPMRKLPPELRTIRWCTCSLARCRLHSNVWRECSSACSKFQTSVFHTRIAGAELEQF